MAIKVLQNTDYAVSHSDAIKVRGSKTLTQELQRYDDALFVELNANASLNVPKKYIDGSTPPAWVSHDNARCAFFRLYKGDVVKIKANGTKEYVIAFLPSMATSGSITSWSNGTNGKITSATANSEDTYLVIEDCYLYVLYNASSTEIDRTPQSIKLTTPVTRDLKLQIDEETSRMDKLFVYSDIDGGITKTGMYIKASDGTIVKSVYSELVCKFYRLKPSVIRVTANGTIPYAIAFINKNTDLDNVSGGNPVNFVNNTGGVIVSESSSSQNEYEVTVECYLYVLINSVLSPNEVDRTPTLKVRNYAFAESILNDAEAYTDNAISDAVGGELVGGSSNRNTGFYINKDTDEWVSNQNGVFYLFEVKKGSVTITPNSNNYAAIAFLSTCEPEAGVGADYVDWLSGVQSVYEETTFNIEEDCLLYVLYNASNTATVRYPSKIYYIGGMLGELDVKVKVLDEVVLKRPFSYEGERPIFMNFNVNLLTTLNSAISSSKSQATLHQGMAIHGDYFVCYGFNTGKTAAAIGLYNIVSGEKIAEIDIPYTGYVIPHGNVLTFGSSLYSNNSVLPLLYISQWDDARNVFVYDIRLSGTTYSATLVQVIKPDTSIDASKFGASNACVDWAVDAENGLIYSIGYTLGGSSGSGTGPYTDNDSTNPTLICKFALPTVDSTIEHTLGTSDIIDNFAVKSLPFRQGVRIKNNKMLISRGHTQSELIGNKVDIHIIDLVSKSVVTKIPLNDFCSLNPTYEEIEGVDIYNGCMVIGWRGSRNLFMLSF